MTPATDDGTDDSVITTPEAAERLGVSQSRIRVMVNAGDLVPLKRQERPLRFPESAVVELERLRRPKRFQALLRRAREEFERAS